MSNLINYKPEDISHSLARSAHLNTSYYPEKRAKQEQDGYCEQMQSVSDDFQQWVTNENIIEIKADLEEYRTGYVRKYSSYLGSRSRCASTMITGGSNFNVRRNDKANDSANNRLNEYLEWNKKAIRRLEQRYNPARKYTGIKSSDSDAIEKLEAKLEGLIKDQEQMKLYNKLVRKHIGKKAEKLTDETRQNLIEALVENGIASNKESAAKSIAPDYAGRIVLSYQLTNNNAAIRNTKKRIAHLKATKAKKTIEETVNGVAIERNYDENRLRLKFDGKPSKNIRLIMGRNGFRWTPSLKVWQAYMTADGYKLQNVLDAIESGV